MGYQLGAGAGASAVSISSIDDGCLLLLYIYTDRIWGTNEVPVPVPVPVPVMLDPYFYFLSRKNLLQPPGASAGASASARVPGCQSRRLSQ